MRGRLTQTETWVRVQRVQLMPGYVDGVTGSAWHAACRFMIIQSDRSTANGGVPVIVPCPLGPGSCTRTSETIASTENAAANRSGCLEGCVVLWLIGYACGCVYRVIMCVWCRYMGQFCETCAQGFTRSDAGCSKCGSVPFHAALGECSCPCSWCNNIKACLSTSPQRSLFTLPTLHSDGICAVVDCWLRCCRGKGPESCANRRHTSERCFGSTEDCCLVRHVAAHSLLCTSFTSCCRSLTVLLARHTAQVRTGSQCRQHRLCGTVATIVGTHAGRCCGSRCWITAGASCIAHERTQRLAA